MSSFLVEHDADETADRDGDGDDGAADLAALSVRGYSATLFRDDDVAAAIEAGLVAWAGSGPERLMIDRFDGRGLLQSWAELQYDGPYEEDPGCSNIMRILLARERYAELPPPEVQARQFTDPPQEEQPATAASAPVLTAPVEEPAVIPAQLLPVPAGVLVPSTAPQLALIIATAMRILASGPQLELLVRVKQRDNPGFAFLDPEDELHLFYLHAKRRGSEPPAAAAASATHDPAPTASLLGIDYDSDDEGEGGPADAEHAAFLPRAPPPPPPPDAIKEVMDKLIAYTKRNGRAFVTLLAERERANPKFAFLHAWSPWHTYFTWALEEALADAPRATAAAAATAAATAAHSGVDAAAVAAAAEAAAVPSASVAPRPTTDVSAAPPLPSAAPAPSLLSAPVSLPAVPPPPLVPAPVGRKRRREEPPRPSSAKEYITSFEVVGGEEGDSTVVVSQGVTAATLATAAAAAGGVDSAAAAPYHARSTIELDADAAIDTEEGFCDAAPSH